MPAKGLKESPCRQFNSGPRHRRKRAIPLMTGPAPAVLGGCVTIVHGGSVSGVGNRVGIYAV